MQLEDHAGDMVRKACAMGNLALDSVAAASGISEEELAAFAATGQTRQKINFARLGEAIGLNPQKLEAVVGGWLPTPKDLSVWQKLQVFTTQDNEMSVNCYLIWDTATRSAALFDTGLDAKPVLDLIASENLILQDIFITHTHWDHVEALPKFRTAFPQARLHSGSPKAPAKQRNQPGEMVRVGDLQISHCETPGHANDGVTYVISHWPEGAPQVAVVGDAIFAGSIGRGNQSWDLARQKVAEHILTLPLNTLICPGHGPLTTVAEEKEYNPFF